MVISQKIHAGGRWEANNQRNGALSLTAWFLPNYDSAVTFNNVGHLIISCFVLIPVAMPPTVTPFWWAVKYSVLCNTLNLSTYRSSPPHQNVDINFCSSAYCATAKPDENLIRLSTARASGQLNYLLQLCDKLCTYLTVLRSQVYFGV